MTLTEARAQCSKIRTKGFLTEVVSTRQDGEILPSAYIIRVNQRVGNAIAEQWVTDCYEESDVDSFVAGCK